MSCSNCRFHAGDECRRFPPQVITGNNRLFPLTQDSDWCGEWAAKPASAKDSIPAEDLRQGFVQGEIRKF